MRFVFTGLPLLRFRAELNRNRLDELSGLDHGLRGDHVSLEMWRFHMRPVRILIGINLEESQAGGIVFLGHTVDGQDPGSTRTLVFISSLTTGKLRE